VPAGRGSNMSGSGGGSFFVIIGGGAFGESIESRVEGREQKKREQRGKHQTADDPARQGEGRFAAFAHPEHPPPHADRRGGGRHQDGTKAGAPGFHGGIDESKAPAS